MAKPEIYEVGKEFYLLKSAEEDFHRNIYIKRFVGADGPPVNMLFDPGTKPDVAALTAALTEVIGGIQNVHLVFLSHQDPDIVSNVNLILANAPKSFVLASVDSWRLIRMLGIPEARFYQLENKAADVLHVRRTGHKILPIAATYCHFRGAMMLYDYESGVLFSGDFLGGLNTRKGPGIYADDASWEGISLFHQIYMPAQKAVQATVDRITELEPFPKVIAPQHGDVVRGENVTEFLTRLSRLDVGVDLVEVQDAEKELSVAALVSFLDGLRDKYADVHRDVLAQLKRTGDFTTPFRFAGDTITDLKVMSADGAMYVWKAVERNAPAADLADIKFLFSSALDDHNINIPPDFFGGSEALGDLLDVVAEGASAPGILETRDKVL